ncbi:MAG: ABC transporter substrate-binding protein, partial [Planctomycetota bacterium]
MMRNSLVFCLFLLSVAPLFCQSQKIRLADVGWTDITATTAITAELLRSRGYQPEIRTLSVPVTFRSLQTGDMDVFLGNWMPTQSNDILPYLQKKTVQKVAVNLVGARFTLAVPKYVYDAGVTSAQQLAPHIERFHRKIYGIEAGNDGNRLILEMIEKNDYQLKGWTLIESSEQAMLMEAKRAIDQKQWIVFLGWQPHPMNTKMEMVYLDDPLEIWGPGGGLSEVHTILSTQFVQQSPQLLPFFENLTFTLEMENEWMRQLLEEGKEPEVMAKAWLQEHPEQKELWLKHLPKLENTSNSTEQKEPFQFLFGLPKLPLGRGIEN